MPVSGQQQMKVYHDHHQEEKFLQSFLWQNRFHILSCDAIPPKDFYAFKQVR